MASDYNYANLCFQFNLFFISRQAKDRYFYDGAESLKGFPTSEFDIEMKTTDDRQSDLMGPVSGNFATIQQGQPTGTMRSNVTQFTRWVSGLSLVQRDRTVRNFGFWAKFSKDNSLKYLNFFENLY
jgi:hypothetical protein